MFSDFNIPLVDILSDVGNLIAHAIQSNQPELLVRIGIASIVWNLIVYAVGIYFGWWIMAKKEFTFYERVTLTSLERGFIVLGLAGLFNHAISAFVGNLLLLAFGSEKLD